MGNVLTINRTPQDFVAKTRHLSVEDRGAYQEILDQIVILGQDVEPPSLPDDDQIIANLLGWPVAKWRKAKPRLCVGTHAVLLVDGGRISQTRIVEEIDAAKVRIAGAGKAGRASGESRRLLRERLLNGRSTDVEPEVQRTGNADGNGSRTSHESRAMSHEKEAQMPTASSLLLPDDADGAMEIVQRVAGIVAPNMQAVDDIQASLWLRDINPDPWWIAAVICEAEGSLVNAKKPGYIAAILRERQELGWVCAMDAREYVGFRMQSIAARGGAGRPYPAHERKAAL